MSMTPKQPADAANTPRTAAGRNLLAKPWVEDKSLMRGHILAIEAEAAAPTSAEHYMGDDCTEDYIAHFAALERTAPTPATRCNWCSKPLDSEGRCRTPGCEASTTPEPQGLNVDAMHRAVCQSAWLTNDAVHDPAYPGEWPCADIVARYQAEARLMGER